MGKRVRGTKIPKEELDAMDEDERQEALAFTTDFVSTITKNAELYSVGNPLWGPSKDDRYRTEQMKENDDLVATICQGTLSDLKIPLIDELVENGNLAVGGKFLATLLKVEDSECNSPDPADFPLNLFVSKEVETEKLLAIGCIQKRDSFFELTVPESPNSRKVVVAISLYDSPDEIAELSFKDLTLYLFNGKIYVPHPVHFCVGLGPWMSHPSHTESVVKQFYALREDYDDGSQWKVDEHNNLAIDRGIDIEEEERKITKLAEELEPIGNVSDIITRNYEQYDISCLSWGPSNLKKTRPAEVAGLDTQVGKSLKLVFETMNLSRIFQLVEEGKGAVTGDYLEAILWNDVEEKNAELASLPLKVFMSYDVDEYLMARHELDVVGMARYRTDSQKLSVIKRQVAGTVTIDLETSPKILQANSMKRYSAYYSNGMLNFSYPVHAAVFAPRDDPKRPPNGRRALDQKIEAQFLSLRRMYMPGGKWTTERDGTVCIAHDRLEERKKPRNIVAELFTDILP